MLGLVGIVRQEGVSVRLIFFHDFDIWKVVVLLEFGRPLVCLVSVSQGVPLINSVLLVNDAVMVSCPGFDSSVVIVVRVREDISSGEEQTPLFVKVD